METKPEYQTETKALVPRQALTPTVWQMIMAIAQTTSDSQKFNARSSEETAIKMLMAHEHNIPLTSALSAVYVIDKKPSLAPVLMWAKALAHPDFGGYEEQRLTNPDGSFLGWELTVWRKSNVKATRRFTMDDAARVGLIDKHNWKNYPEDTCYWRAISRVLKAVFADVTQGIYGADELGASITPDGNVIDADPWTATVKDPDLEPEPVEPEPITMAYLLETWGAAQVMESTSIILGSNSTGPTIPTEDQLEAVAAELEHSGAPKMGEAF